MAITATEWGFLFFGIVVGMWIALICVWIQDSIDKVSK